MMDRAAIREISRDLVARANALDDKDTRELWLDSLQTFAKTGDLAALKEACTWRRKVVPIDEYIFGKAFLGLDRDEIFPAVVDACADLDSGAYYEAVLMGGLGIGKSTVANIMLSRSLYRLSCMRNPQSSFGGQRRTGLVFTIQSVRLNTAKKAIFSEFGQLIHNSPYFKTYYMYDKNVTSTMIFREQNVQVMPVSSSTTGAISMNVIGGILDEMNFMQKITHSKSSLADEQGAYDQAKQMYNILSRRRKSRFAKQGKLPGILFIVSSTKFPDDFTERKAKEAVTRGGTNAGIYVYHKSLWEAKGRDRYMPESFRVMVGSATVRSRVLEGDDEPLKGHDVIEVPMDFYNEFKEDADGALRDFAGITTKTSLPFITKPEALGKSVISGKAAGYKNPLNVEEVDLSLGLPIPDRQNIRYDIHVPRACHVDLGQKKDACGLAVGHIAGFKLINRLDEGKKFQTTEVLPIIAYDIILRIKPPHRGEIEFADVRRFIVNLRDKYNIPIKWVTYDGWNSVDSRQILKRLNFSTELQSVEKPELWHGYRDAFYEERILMFNHNFLVNELARLERTVRNNKERIDHPSDGTKDVADAACGVYNLLATRKQAWPHYANFIGGKTGMFLYGDPTRRVDVQPDEDIDEALKRDPFMAVPKIGHRRVATRRIITRRAIGDRR